MANFTHSLDGDESQSTEAVVDQISDRLWIYAGLPMLGIGTIGHVLSLFVLLGSKRMRKLSMSIYLVASAVSGLLALHSGLLRQILQRIGGYEKDVRNETSDEGCRIHAALTYFSLQSFSWLQASVAVERVIALCYPLRYKRWCTWQRNLAVVAALTTILASFNVIVVVSFEKTAKQICEATEEYLFDQVWGIFDLLLYAAMPIAVIVPCNIVTVYFMLKTREIKNSNSPKGSIRRTLQFTIMLLTHNIVCVITTLPISIIFLVPWPKDKESSEHRLITLLWTIFSLLQYLGSTLGFTVYSILAEKFRKAIHDIFCRGFNVDISSDSTNSSFKSFRRSDSGGATRLRRLSHSSGPSTRIPINSQETQLDDDPFIS